MKATLLITCAAASLAIFSARPADAAWRLERTVLLMRHGVRSELSTPALDRISKRPWPAWEVSKGEVTPHGAELVTLMGQYFRARYARAGLLPAASRCPDPGSVAIWTDVDKRTKATGAAFVAGFAPGCSLEPQHIAKGRDAVFTPQQAGICPIDISTARREIMARAGGSLEVPIAAHLNDYVHMQSLLSDHTCGMGPDCLLSLAPAITLNRHQRLAISGPVGVAATAAETFLMQYADDWPLARVGWGEVGPEQIGSLLTLKDVAFDFAYRTPYLARVEGSILLHRMVQALAGDRGQSARSAAFAHAVVSILVAHDGNLAVVATLLGLHWTLPGLPPDQTPPGGILAFSLWQDTDTGQREVRVTYSTQSIVQLRDATPLTLAHPPLSEAVTIPGCGNANGVCSVPVFEAIARAAEDPDCLGAPTD